MIGRRHRDRAGDPGDLGRGASFVRGRKRRRSGLGRLTGLGAAALLALVARQSGRRPAGEEQAHVEVTTGNFHIADHGREVLDALIAEAAAAHGLSAHLVRAVVQAESAFDPDAQSPVGAQGLMQLMPATAVRMGVSDRRDPRQNVFGGTKYLSQLLDRFDGNVALALAGYNAGPARVTRYRGIPPYGETRGYVTKIRRILADTTGTTFPLPMSRRTAESKHRRGHRPVHRARG